MYPPSPGEFFPTVVVSDISTCSEDPSHLRKMHNDIVVYYQNTRGLRSKTDKILNSTHLHEYSVIALTETWLDPSIDSSELFSAKYPNVYRSDRDFPSSNRKKGGGVLLAVSDVFTSSTLDLNTPQFDKLSRIDIVGVKISCNSQLLYIINIYIPPNTTYEDYEYLFEAIESLDCLYNNDILIVGDFNISAYASYLHDSQTNRLISMLNNFLNIFNMSQHNFIYNENNRLLDLVLYNKMCTVEKSLEPLVAEDSHHPALEISFKIYSSTNLKHNFPVNYSNCYNFRKANFLLLYESISNIDWSFLCTSLDVEDACTRFYDKLYSIFDLYVPKVTSQHNKRYPPWFTSEIIKNIKLKAKLLHNYKHDNDLNAFEEFKRLRAKIKLDINISYKNYIIQAENSIQSAPNKFWAFIKSKKGSTNISNNMFYNGVKLDNPRDILNSYADYFSKSFTPSSDVSSDDNECLSSSQLHISKFEFNDVLTALKQIKPKMTTGPDAVPAFIVRDCAYVLAAPLQILFNLCLSTCTFPNIWKYSKVCPIYKKGDKYDIMNFRPISLLCNFSKAFEFLLHNSIHHHVSSIISPYQHGFMKGRSTTTNLVVITQFIAKSIDMQAQTDVVYTDFSKAFDRLDHNILLKKLTLFGLSPALVMLFVSYLSRRKQYVVFGGFKSVEYLATSGVPQGSVLGPLLFNIFINDILTDLNVNCLLYADDLKIFEMVRSSEDCERIQRNLDKISNWCVLNKLPLNPQKCNVMSYTLKISTLDFNYTLEDTTLERPNTFRDLGVIFDKKLSFNNHIESIVCEACRSYGFIARNSREFRDINTVKMLYNSFVRSKLEYAAIVWYPQYDVHIGSLEGVQRRLLKLLCFKSDKVYPPIGIPQNELLEKHSMVSLLRRREYHSQILLSKIINNKIDCQDIVAQLNFHVPRISSRDNVTFYLPTARTNILQHSPIYIMCNNCNLVGSRLDIFSCSLNDIRAVYLE